MPVIAIINSKGGSGKSTLATHVAAWLAHQGHATMLGDVDRQQSAVHWLRRRQQRAPAHAALVGWALDPHRILRPPAGVTHAVLDTPGGLHGLEFNRVLGSADLVLVPVGEGAFDREAAAQTVHDLRAHPRVASGRVQVAVVGMRMAAGVRAERRLRQWLDAQGAALAGVMLAGVVPDSRIYPHCAARGLTVFDLPADRMARQLACWSTVMDWITQAIDRLAQPPQRAAGASTAAPIGLPSGRPAALPPTRKPMAAAPLLTPVALPSRWRAPAGGEVGAGRWRPATPPPSGSAGAASAVRPERTRPGASLWQRLGAWFRPKPGGPAVDAGFAVSRYGR